MHLRAGNSAPSAPTAPGARRGNAHPRRCLDAATAIFLYSGLQRPFEAGGACVATTERRSHSPDPAALADARAEWTARELHQSLAQRPERRDRFESLSGLPVERLYGPDDLTGGDYLRDIGFPGRYPYTQIGRAHVRTPVTL